MRNMLLRPGLQANWAVFVADSRSTTPIQRDSADPYEVYHPSARAFEESRDTFPLPNYLRAVIKNSSRLSRSLPEMDVYSKQADTVDWGDEVDYSGYEWFKDPPPRPEVRSTNTLFPRADEPDCVRVAAPAAAGNGAVRAPARRHRAERHVRLCAEECAERAVCTVQAVRPGASPL